jgi:flagellar hook assembly protein FlgD
MSTQISFSLDKSSAVSLAIYNIMGQHMCTLVNGKKSAGHHVVTWNGMDDNNMPASSGVYIVRLTAGREVRSNKLLLLK